MPASQAGRRRFESGRPLQKLDEGVTGGRPVAPSAFLPSSYSFRFVSPRTRVAQAAMQSTPESTSKSAEGAGTVATKPCSGPPWVSVYEPVISLPLAEIPSTLVEKAPGTVTVKVWLVSWMRRKPCSGPPGVRVYDPAISLPFAETPVTTVELAPGTLTVWKIGSASTPPAKPRDSATIPKNARIGGTLLTENEPPGV